MTSPIRLFFVSYGAGHIAMILPVIRVLRERHPCWHITLMALTTAAHEARRQGFDHVGYRDFVHWYDSARLRSLAAPWLESTRHPLVAEDETLAYLGINLADLEDQMGVAQAAQCFQTVGRWAFRPAAFMKRVLQEFEPDMVIATNSPRSEQTALEVAGSLGIPTLCMVDLFSPEGDPFLSRSSYADAITTITDRGKSNLVAGGVPADRIHVTGSPAFDSLFAPVHAKDAARDRSELGWDNLHVILWAGHLEVPLPGAQQLVDPAGFPRETERVLRAYVAANPHSALVIRYHPNHAAHFDASHPQERVLWSEASDRHVHRDIQLADVAVVQATTVGLEAAIAGKSVISLDHSPSRPVFPCSELGVSRGVASFDALPGALDQAFARPFRSELARSKADAAVQVADVIEEQLKPGRAFGTAPGSIEDLQPVFGAGAE